VVGGLTKAVVTGVASALPPTMDQQGLIDDYFADWARSPRLARAAFSASGVRRRHGVVDPRVEDVSSWPTARRMDRFVKAGVPLAAAAVSGALDQAHLDPSEVGLLAVVSCTGYATPGIDVLVARELAMAPTTQRLSIGHVGCHAALPGLGVVGDFAAQHGEPAVLCCLELPSLHVQPPDEDPEQLIVHALFGDAAAAVVLEPSTAPHLAVVGASSAATPRPPFFLELVATAARSDLEAADQMTWKVTDRGFRMTLSRTVPRVLSAQVGPLLNDLLGPAGLDRSDVAHLGVHPGGPRVLDAVAHGLGLCPQALAASRTVLAEHGNCSSATILLVLEALGANASIRPGEHVVLVAFGPGLTCYGALLRAC